MTAANDSPLCHTCTHLVREPTEPAAVRMAEHGAYACRLLEPWRFMGAAVRCHFTPPRHQPHKPEETCNG
ncbi:MAG: hypothetical protein WA924_04885 [Burkholderiaceae bacterium]